VAGDVLFAIAPAVFVEPAPDMAAVPVGVLAGTQGSGLPFGTGAPGCRLPDWGAVDVPCVVATELPPEVAPEGVVELCASRQTMSAAVSKAVAPLTIVIFT